MLGALKSAKTSISDKTLPESKKERANEKGFNQTNKVFIVHGHDEKAKNELEVFLKRIGLDKTPFLFFSSISTNLFSLFAAS